MPTTESPNSSTLTNLLDVRFKGSSTPEGRLELAKFVLQYHQRDYAAPKFIVRPKRPDDDELIEQYTKARKGVSITDDMRRHLGNFSKWRMVVWRIESDSGIRLATVVNAALTFEAAGGHRMECEMLFSFAEKQYQGFKRRDVPRDADFDVLREWCMKITKNFALLPVSMRTMKHPRSSQQIEVTGPPWGKGC